MTASVTPQEAWEHRQREAALKQAISASANLSPLLRLLEPALGAIVTTCQVAP